VWGARYSEWGNGENEDLENRAQDFEQDAQEICAQKSLANRGTNFENVDHQALHTSKRRAWHSRLSGD